MSYFTDEQAKEIWKAKWRGETVQSLIQKHGENPFRFYEVWSEEKNQGTRIIAFEEFKRDNPQIALRTVPAVHVQKRKVIPIQVKPSPNQLEMF